MGHANIAVAGGVDVTSNVCAAQRVDRQASPYQKPVLGTIGYDIGLRPKDFSLYHSNY